MKILLINDYGTATGGAELQMLSLKKDLQARGHKVKLFTSNYVIVKNSPLLADYSCYGTDSPFQVISQTFNLSAYFQLKKILVKFNPDIIHVRMFLWQLSPLILPLLKPFPCLYQTAIYKAICPIGTKILPDGSHCNYKAGGICLTMGCVTSQSWAFLMIQRQLWQRWRNAFNVVVALSYGMKNRLESDGITHIKVVYNGVAEREERPPLNNPPTVAYAGRLSKEKGIDVLFKAFAKVVSFLPNVKLMIAGEGKEETNLRQLAQKLDINDNITWLGYLTRNDLENVFNQAWLQVVPSVWDEPFGNVTTEAMMRGTGVVASAVGAQPEIIENGVTGILVPPNDVQSLFDALLKLLQNQELAEKMGKAGRQRAILEFSEKRRTDNFLKIYQQLLILNSNNQEKK